MQCLECMKKAEQTHEEAYSFFRYRSACPLSSMPSLQSLGADASSTQIWNTVSFGNLASTGFIVENSWQLAWMCTRRPRREQEGQRVDFPLYLHFTSEHSSIVRVWGRWNLREIPHPWFWDGDIVKPWSRKWRACRSIQNVLPLPSVT